jgi:hypothetical protein
MDFPSKTGALLASICHVLGLDPHLKTLGPIWSFRPIRLPEFISPWTLDPCLMSPLVSQHVFPSFILSAHIPVLSFSFFLNFAVCKYCPFFPFFEHFPLELRLLKGIFPISSKKICSHSAKIHQEKSPLCREFPLIFHSGFICYDHPCNFSFSSQPPPIIAAGQGEPAPTLVHSPCWGRPLGFRF